MNNILRLHQYYDVSALDSCKEVVAAEQLFRARKSAKTIYILSLYVLESEILYIMDTLAHQRVLFSSKNKFTWAAFFMSSSQSKAEGTPSGSNQLHEGHEYTTRVDQSAKQELHKGI